MRFLTYGDSEAFLARRVPESGQLVRMVFTENPTTGNEFKSKFAIWLTEWLLSKAKSLTNGRIHSTSRSSLLNAIDEFLCQLYGIEFWGLNFHFGSDVNIHSGLGADSGECLL